jgi:hypothetical protein
VSPLTPAQRSERARIAANIRWSRVIDRHAATAPGLRAISEKFEREADPAGLLSPSDRAKRAENLRKAHLARIRLKASRKAQQRLEAVAQSRARGWRE